MNTHSYDPEKESPEELKPNHLDGQIREALSSVKPPELLKASILEQGPAPERKLLSFPSVRVAIAAIVIIGFVFSFLLLKMGHNNELQYSSNLREAAADYIVDAGFLLDLYDSSLDNISEWLEEKQAPNYSELPKALADLQPIGCKQLTWREEPITLVCFHLDDDRIVHLFIGNQTHETETLLANISEIQRIEGLETAGWHSGQQLFLLTGSNATVSIQPYLEFSS
ncbi:MAG: hypothetical protein AAF065_06670 [Verrucomicrobiota bacterium]